MKELSIEEKAKRYDEAIKKAKFLKENTDGVGAEDVSRCFEEIFPELKENEDERIKKELIMMVKLSCTDGDDVDKKNAWFEKQGEQKPADKVEPKFHEGEWIVHHGTENIYQVVAVIDNQYQLKYGDNYTIQYCADVDRCARLWDITRDAKDGDVLYSPCLSLLWIFKSKDTVYCGCNLNYNDGAFCGEGYFERPTDAIPATKEQRDTLEKAMADAGYTFDFKKRELKHTEQNSAESKQETKPNGGIIYEDFNEGNGYYKMNLAYLSKSQVELIENLVVSWQNTTSNTAKWEPSKEQMDALKGITVKGGITYVGQGQELMNLYNDLKKLM